MKFCSNMKKLRKNKHISQATIAKLLNVSQRTISHYESGTCQPNLDGLCKIADVLEVSIDELVGHELPKKEY